MSDKPYRKRGKRAGHAPRPADVRKLRDIHSKLEGRPNGTHTNHSHNLHGTSVTYAAMDAAKSWDCAEDVEETPETHLVPRRSLSYKQLLKVLPPDIETETRKAWQLDQEEYKRTGKIAMIETSDQRLTYKSDRTLLNKGKPFEKIGTFKRAGSVSVGLTKRNTIRTETEIVTTEAHKLPKQPGQKFEAVKIDIKTEVLGPAIDAPDL